MPDKIINGIKNCHAIGVDSVVLGTENGKLVRAFIAHENHNLYLTNPFSVGFHPHHCDLTIKVVEGSIINVTLISEFALGAHSIEELATYRYESAIRNGDKGAFTQVMEKRPFGTLARVVNASQSLALPASAIHTILIYARETATWIIHEGDEDPNYVADVYSNADLTKASGEGLYLPMTDEEYQAAKARVLSL